MLTPTPNLHYVPTVIETIGRGLVLAGLFGILAAPAAEAGGMEESKNNSDRR